MLDTYFPILLQTLIACGFAGVTLLISVMLGKASRSNEMKDSAYECGMLPIGRNWAQVHVRYYLIAILFLVFDVELLFLYPWAVSTYQPVDGESTAGIPVALRDPVFAVMLVFLVTLGIAYVYAWKKGVFKWR